MRLALITSHNFKGLLLALALLMVSCAKEPLDAPMQAAALESKGMSATILSGTDTENGGTDNDGKRDTDTDTISDDGDDVGDGERNKKKKPD
ncbi:MAG: hypothetical protein IPL52_06145 [Flavobacteriales bacterium]|nr:hypothetical protein [Flavobacteriales bacterium]